MDVAIDTIISYIGQADEATRRRAVAALRDLAASLETPHDTLLRVCYRPIELMVAKIAVDTKLFKILAASNKPQTTQEIATQSGVDPDLLNRLLKYLAAFSFIKESGEKTYEPTRITKTFAEPGYEDGIWFHFNFYNKIILATPDFLKENDYQNPTNALDTPFGKGFDTKELGFQWLSHNPDYLSAFSKFMSTYHKDKMAWTNSIPIEEQCQGWTSNAPLFIDLGGGLGFQCVAFRDALGGLPGRIVLQDLPDTLNQGPPHEGVEKMPHNFWDAQPIKGAKYYYMRNILHDYPDDRALTILTHTAAACGPDSTILIDELCVPDTGAPGQTVQQDMAMMITQASVERTKRQWLDLLDRAGLEVRKMSTYTVLECDTLIECVPKVLVNDD